MIAASLILDAILKVGLDLNKAAAVTLIEALFAEHRNDGVVMPILTTWQEKGGTLTVKFGGWEIAAVVPSSIAPVSK